MRRSPRHLLPGHLLPRLLLAALGLIAAGSARSDPQIAVIVARDAPHIALAPATLRDIYLKKIFVDEHGHALVPANLPPGHALRRAFAADLFRRPQQALQRYWNERYFHGVRPPYVLGSQNAVLRFVAHTEGAIGYVASCRVDASVRTVLTLPVPAAERAAVARLCAPS